MTTKSRPVSEIEMVLSIALEGMEKRLAEVGVTLRSAIIETATSKKYKGDFFAFTKPDDPFQPLHTAKDKLKEIRRRRNRKS